jgi:hypothetical protein
MAWKGVTYTIANRLADEFLNTGMFEVDPSRPGHEEEIAATLRRLILDKMGMTDSLTVTIVNSAVNDAMDGRGNR